MNACRITAYILAAMLCGCVVSCAGQPPRDVWTLEGWDGNDCYLVRAKGEVTTGVTNTAQRKGHSLVDAEANAKIALFERFGLPIQRPRKNDPRLKFWCIINSGRAAAVNYGADERCDIVFEVKWKGLRQMAEANVPAK